MRFIVELELGNDGMRHGIHIARALREVASKVSGNICMDACEYPSECLRDVNGNTIGSFRQEKGESEKAKPAKKRASRKAKPAKVIPLR